MDRRLRNLRGGILGVLEELEAHGGAITYDLLAVGLRLDDIGTGRCTWAEVKDVIEHSPRQSSAYMRAKYGAAVEWGPAVELLAQLFDLTQHYRWLDTGKKGPSPKPFPRPGVQGADDGTRVFGRGTSMTPAEFDAWLAEQETNS